MAPGLTTALRCRIHLTTLPSTATQSNSPNWCAVHMQSGHAQSLALTPTRRSLRHALTSPHTVLAAESQATWHAHLLTASWYSPSWYSPRLSCRLLVIPNTHPVQQTSTENPLLTYIFESLKGIMVCLVVPETPACHPAVQQ